MFLRRLFRFVFCWVVAMVVLGLVLPYAGINPAHYLPPPMVFKKAQGIASGRITNKYSVQTNDPFNVGARLYFWDYAFLAKQMDPVKKKPVESEVDGEVRVPKEAFNDLKVDDPVQVRYEKTYPWINGLDGSPTVLGCGPASNILSGWLIWLGASIVLGFIFMAILQQFLPKEDI